MMKLIVISILFSLIFVGCATKEVVYMQPSCPYIKVLRVVPKVEGNISAEGVTPVQLDEILKAAYMLRKSETYYSTQITKYNNKYSTTLDNK